MTSIKKICSDCEKPISQEQIRKREAKEIPIRSAWRSFPKTIFLCKDCAAKPEPQINTILFN